VVGFLRQDDRLREIINMNKSSKTMDNRDIPNDLCKRAFSITRSPLRIRPNIFFTG
jgi:hypothetical protein